MGGGGQDSPFLTSSSVTVAVLVLGTCLIHTDFKTVLLCSDYMLESQEELTEEWRRWKKRKKTQNPEQIIPNLCCGVGVGGLGIGEGSEPCSQGCELAESLSSE